MVATRPNIPDFLWPQVKYKNVKKKVGCLNKVPSQFVFELMPNISIFHVEIAGNLKTISKGC